MLFGLGIEVFVGFLIVNIFICKEFLMILFFVIYILNIFICEIKWFIGI